MRYQVYVNGQIECDINATSYAQAAQTFFRDNPNHGACSVGRRGTSAERTFTRPTTNKPAQLVAGFVQVLCPECGAEQVNPVDNSELWSREDIRNNTGKIQCNSCDVDFVLSGYSKVRLD